MESRGGRYGRFLAALMGYVVSSFPSEHKAEFLKEVKNYSFMPRKKGAPMNEGCVRELEKIAEFDVKNPAHLGRLVKEGIHLMYVKDTSYRVMKSFFESMQ